MPTERAYQAPPSATADVLCIGGINLDRKLKAFSALNSGSSNPCLAHESPGGVARNVAENLARLGLAVKLAGQVGRDAAALSVLAPLQELGVNTSACCAIDNGSTGSYTAVLDAQGRLVLGMADMALIETLLPAQLEAMHDMLDARLWLADMNLPSVSLTWMTRRARELNQRLVMLAVSEPKMNRLPQDLKGVDTLLLNRGELAALCEHLGWHADAGDSVENAFAKLHQAGLQRLVVTQGKQGVLCIEMGQVQAVQLMQQVPSDVTLIDETGAGDALCAGLCASYLRYPADALAAHVQRALKMAVLTVQSAQTVSPAITPDLI